MIGQREINEIVAAARNIRGWMSDVELVWLAEQASTRQRIVEFGAYQGHSTYALASTTPGTVYVVDDWRGEPAEKGEPKGAELYEAFEGNMHEFIRAGTVIPFTMTTTAFADLQWIHELFDFIFIDASHDPESVYQDCLIAQRLAAPAALIAGHDFHHPGLADAVRRVFPTADQVASLPSIWAVPS